MAGQKQLFPGQPAAVAAGTLRRRNPTRQLSTIALNTDVLCTGLALFGLVFVTVLGKFGALLFLAAGAILLIRHVRALFAITRQNWYILALPAFCILSALWSIYPETSARFGVQLMATVLIAIMIASTVSARDFTRLLFALYSLAIVASAVFGEVRSDTGAWLGIYGSKNAMAGTAATYVIICTAQMLDSHASYRFRILALLGAMTGFLLLLQAQSVSALALLPPALMIQFLLLVLYRLSPMQRVVSVAFAMLLSALMALLILANSDALFGAILEATGKDVTLTGRTDLWRIAARFIAERPILGVGYQAFWVPGHAPAEALWHMFGIESRGGFNFHNTYVSNAVEIGILGVMLQSFVLFGAAVTTGLWTLRTHRTDAALLFLLVVMVVMISVLEVPIFFQFSLRSVIVICAFVYGIRGLRSWRHHAKLGLGP